MRLELPSTNRQRHIREPLVVKERAQVIRQPTLGHLELDDVALAADVDTVGHHRHFAEYRQLVLGQEAVRLVQQEVSGMFGRRG